MNDEGLSSYSLLDRDGSEVAFHGERVGWASSHDPLHSHPGDTAIDGERCSACRWFEVSIYVTDEDEYVVHTIGHSAMPNEIERFRIERTDSAHWVVECLVQYRADGTGFIPITSRRALAEAAAVDEEIERAFTNRAVA